MLSRRSLRSSTLNILAFNNNLGIRLVSLENSEVMTEPIRLKLVKLPSRQFSLEELIDFFQVSALFLC